MTESRSTPAFPAERLLIDAVETASLGGRVLTRSLGRGQLVQALTQLDGVAVDCWMLDQYRSQRMDAGLSDGASAVAIHCAEDPPDGPYDAVVFPFSRRGESELARELLQSAVERLHVGGPLWVSVDHPQDRWMREQLERFDVELKWTCTDEGTVYRGRKRGPLKKKKNYRAEFVFRDQERLYRVETRPGVFAHRRLDTGARRLMQAMQIRPHDRVLEIGCGSGAVCLAAAGREPTAHVVGIDSHSRAVGCTNRSATQNGLEHQVRAYLSHDGDLPELVKPFDRVLANPPYYDNDRIAGRFLELADRVLRSGGEVLFVGKSAAWYLDTMPRYFDAVTVENVKGYCLARGQGRPRP